MAAFVQEDLTLPPTDEEVRDCAAVLGIEDDRLLWIAAKCLSTPLPPLWRAVQTPEADVYYVPSGDRRVSVEPSLRTTVSRLAREGSTSI
jgi:hypothetical protein